MRLVPLTSENAASNAAIRVMIPVAFYANVVAFEVGLHGAAPSVGLSSGRFRPWETSPMSVSNPVGLF